MNNNLIHPQKTPSKNLSFADWREALELANNAPRCGARTRKGNSCLSPAMKNGRCRMHGGKSPGAPAGNQNAFKHGLYSVEMREGLKYFRDLLKRCKEL
jgi:glucans biosynthesis protein